MSARMLGAAVPLLLLLAAAAVVAVLAIERKRHR